MRRERPIQDSVPLPYFLLSVFMKRAKDQIQALISPENDEMRETDAAGDEVCVWQFMHPKSCL